MNKKLISLLLGFMCMLLTLGISIQVKTIENMNSKSITNSAQENELRDSVLKTKEKYDNTYNKIQKLQKELEELQEKASMNSDEATQLQDSLKEYKKLLGLTELTGDGIRITLSDGDESQSKTILDSIVHDGDILQVINALRNAGADAISVNGQRVVNNTAVSCIGNVIKLNGEKIGSPFVIEAIGSPDMLYWALNINGGYLYKLKMDGVNVGLERAYGLVLPQYEGVYNSTFMKPAK